MTEDNHLLEIARAATPGPWRVDHNAPHGGNILAPTGPVADARGYGNTLAEVKADYANAEYIAAFDPPTVISLLLAKQAAEASLKASEAERDRLREVANEAIETIDVMAGLLEQSGYPQTATRARMETESYRQALALSVGSGNKDEGVASEAQSGAGTLPGPTSTPSQAGEGA